MLINTPYKRQLDLLIRVLPIVARERGFALKGGTAINLFFKDLPRLSVDIDLTYLFLKPREQAIQEIQKSLQNISKEIRAMIKDSLVTGSNSGKEEEFKLFVTLKDNTRVKIEVNPVIRGCVYPPQIRVVRDRVEKNYGFAEIQTVSFEDLYAGKIVAALDRQHPRDLFDIKELLNNEGINGKLREVFLAYLLSSNRGFHEILNPNRLDKSQEYDRGFRGMTEISVSLDELYSVRERLIGEISNKMPINHQDFLISFISGTPKWDLLEIKDIKNLPAIKWRLLNQERLTYERRRELIQALQDIFK